jgi:hypothetical protein
MEIAIIISLLALVITLVADYKTKIDYYKHKITMMELDYQSKIARLEYDVLHAKLNSLNDLLKKEKTDGDEVEQTAGNH